MTPAQLIGGDSAPAYRSLLFGSRSRLSQTASSTSAAVIASLGALAPWKRNVLFAVLFCTAVLCLLVNYHPGVQRIYQFWTSVTPWIVEYKWTKFKLNRLLQLPKPQVEERLHQFHQKTAHKAVALVQAMGGIYVKLGQVISTMGVGILQDDYIQAMRPLQDGIPPRSLAEVSKIFQQSTGQRLEDAFEWIDEKPIGAASIAQAHRAVLKKQHPDDPDDVVIVKIQYPEVADLFNADLNNLEICCRLLIPGSKDMVAAVRERHSRELDFREEAQHLRECAHNMQQHKVEPQLVRIPRVRNETGLCTDQVLVMEFLEGQSLNSAIEQEQDRMARALGKEDGKALREFVLERIGEHLEQTHANATDAGYDEHPNRLQRMATSDFGAGVFRAYVGFRDRVDRVRDGVANLFLPSSQRSERPKRQRPLNMGRILKTLVRVHGLQMLRDGVYNADPHPGNVVVLEDGRLGLLDYGMVGRLSQAQRKSMAKTVLALARKDRQAVNDVYKEAGYRATWREGSVYDDPELVRRFATFHFDKFDLSPVSLGQNHHRIIKKKKDKVLLKTIGGDGSATQPPLQSTVGKRRSLKMLEILETVQEWSVPDWIEQGRRLTGLLAGVSLQAGRPMSMAKEWSAIAEEVLQEPEEEEGGCDAENKA